MRLTLYAPGLLLPKAVLADTTFDLTAPSFSLLLGRGRRFDLRRDWLAAAFGLSAPLPAAALRKVGSGETATGASWLCLDPVHFEVKREGILLSDPACLDLNASEAEALRAAMQPLFAEWGDLSASRPGHWELQLSRSLLLDTRPLDDSIGLPVDPALPGGPDGPAWRRLLAEAQTVLHAHPVNRERADRGQPTVSSLWPWGFGSLPEPKPGDFEIVWSDDAILAGLCAQTGIACTSVPASFQRPDRNVFCHLTHLQQPARTMDALGWRQALLDIEEAWLAPALTAVKQGECQALRLIGTGVHGAERAVVYSLVRNNFWRFWCRPAPLVELATSP
jgi:hypothetical protein